MDLVEEGLCRNAVYEVIDRFGRVDGLVNNAGVNDSVGLESSPDQFRASIEANLTHYFTMTHLCLDLLKKNKAAIVNIGSKVSFTGQGNTSGYAASKGGITSLTREWAAMLLASASISFLQAITNTTVAATTFTLSSIPFLTAIMAWLFLGERIGKSTILTMCIAAAGISLMFVQGFGSGTLYGNFMALLCAVGFSSYAIIIRRTRRVEMLPTLILSNLIIMLVALLFTWDNLAISWNDLLICFILGGLLSATVNTLFLIAAKHLFAAELTLFMLLEFTLGPIWVWIFVNEVPTSWTLVGGSIVISAVFLKSVSELRKAKV
jgi:drug/metabolite transporter (DMT)-like permease